MQDVAYHFSNASPVTPRTELARVVKTGHRIEECLQRGKSEAGLADYEVRTWHGWHHHASLVFAAYDLLAGEGRSPDSPPFPARSR